VVGRFFKKDERGLFGRAALGSGPLDVGHCPVVPRSEHLSKYTHIAALVTAPLRASSTSSRPGSPIKSFEPLQQELIELARPFPWEKVIRLGDTVSLTLWKICFKGVEHMREHRRAL
jgi:hypothetical protein